MSKVSVIIPTYNAAQFIGHAIESVLAQTYTDYEIIVVDDGSTDNTRQILASYEDRICYIYQENQERSIARNNGVAASQGEYIAFLDSDDLILPNKLAVQVSVLDARPTVGLVASGYQYVSETGQLLQEVKPWVHNSRLDLEALLFRGLTVIHAVLMRRSWFDRIEGFAPRFSGPEDMDLWYRLSLAGCTMIWEPAIVCQYRIHKSNSSRNVTQHYDAHFAILDELFARSDLPTHLYGRRGELYAHVRLSEAAKLYGAGSPNEAKASVRSALALDPGLLSNGGEGLAGRIAGWQRSIWIRDPPRFLELVLDNLPTEISPSVLRRKVYAARAKSKFYDAFERGDAAAIQRLWIKVLCQDPSWLLNRGGVSILLQSFGWLGKRRRSTTSREHP